jgi:hypothetical protein
VGAIAVLFLVCYDDVKYPAITGLIFLCWLIYQQLFLLLWAFLINFIFLFITKNTNFYYTTILPLNNIKFVNVFDIFYTMSNIEVIAHCLYTLFLCFFYWHLRLFYWLLVIGSISLTLYQ